MILLYNSYRLVAMAEGNHTFPSRTRPLSPPAPMVLGPQGPGRVGRRQAVLKKYLLQKLSDDDKIISCQEKSNILYLENWIRKYMKHPKRIEFNKLTFV